MVLRVYVEMDLPNQGRLMEIVPRDHQSSRSRYRYLDIYENESDSLP